MTQHWVEALFPPTFKYNDLGELLTSEKQLQEIDKTKFDPSTTSRTAEPIVKIYERVRASYNNELEIRRQKCIQVGDPLRQSAKQKSTSGSLNIPEPTKEDLCLWTNHEMKVLRDAYQTLKEQKMKIDGELKVMEKAFKQKEEKVKRYRKKFEEQCEISRGLSDENMQIEIVSKNTSKELKAAQSVELFLREDIADLENQKHAQQKVIEGLRKDLAQERRNRKRISLDLGEVREKCQQENKLREEGIRLEYDIQMKQLCKEIDRLVKALEKEENDHAISKKGLDHLRSHFTGSVRLANEPDINELKNFTLY